MVTITRRLTNRFFHVMYQSIPAVKIPLGNFLRGQNPHFPGKERLQNPGPWGKNSCVKKLCPPAPRQNKTEEIDQKYMLKRHINLLKLGISIKQNHLLKLKYSLHMCETVYHIVVLVSINRCITVVLQIHSLKLSESYLKMAENVLSSSNYRAQAEWYL